MPTNLVLSALLILIPPPPPEPLQRQMERPRTIQRRAASVANGLCTQPDPVPRSGSAAPRAGARFRPRFIILSAGLVCSLLARHAFAVVIARWCNISRACRLFSDGAPRNESGGRSSRARSKIPLERCMLAFHVVGFCGRRLSAGPCVIPAVQQQRD